MSRRQGGRPGAMGLDLGPRVMAGAQVALARSWDRRVAAGRAPETGDREGRAAALAAAAIIPRAAHLTDTPDDRTMSAETWRVSVSEAIRLREALWRQGFVVSGAVLAVPPAALLTGSFELPARGAGVPIEDLAREELARTFRRESTGFEMVAWDVPPPARSPGGTHVFAAACDHDSAAAILDPLESAGVPVLALEPRTIAAVRAAGEIVREGMWALAELGEDHTTFALAYDGVVVYERVAREIALLRLRRRLRDSFAGDEDALESLFRQWCGESPAQRFGGAALPAGPDGADAQMLAGERMLTGEYVSSLADELRATLAYAAHRYGGGRQGAGTDTPVRGVLLHGPGARVRDLPARVGDRIGVPVRVLCPRDLLAIRDGASSWAHDPALVVALGLALRPVPGSWFDGGPRGTQINLIPRARVMVRQRNARARAWVAATVGWCGVLAAGTGTVYWIDHARSRAGAPQPADLESLRTQTSRLEEQIAAAKAQAVRLRPLAQAARALAHQPDWSLLLDLLSAAVRGRAMLSSCVLEPVGGLAGEESAGPAGAKAAPPSAPPATRAVPVSTGARAGPPEVAPPSGQRYRLVLSGLALTQQDVSEVVQALEHAGVFERVVIIEARRVGGGVAPAEMDAVSFEVECHLGEVTDDRSRSMPGASGAAATERGTGPGTAPSADRRPVAERSP